MVGQTFTSGRADTAEDRVLATLRKKLAELRQQGLTGKLTVHFNLYRGGVTEGEVGTETYEKIK